jgi:hypothetical protein
MARFRAYGQLAPEGLDALTTRWFNSLPDSYARAILTERGLAASDVDKLITARPLTSAPEALLPH